MQIEGGNALSQIAPLLANRNGKMYSCGVHMFSSLRFAILYTL
jgi:hypothetical protein